MKNLNELYSEGLNIVLESCGEDAIGEINSIRVNPLFKRKLGCCKRKSDLSNDLEVAPIVVYDDTPDDFSLSVIVHEILHTSYDCMDHGYIWKNYAEKVMKKYPNLYISRVTSYKRFGMKPRKIEYKYAVACPSCGKTWKRATRGSKLIKHPEWFSCRKCKEKLIRIDI